MIAASIRAKRREQDMFRSDGLLRGAREDRAEVMSSSGHAKWSLEVFLDLHCGLLDHAEEVRIAAMEALQEISKQEPDPVALTPVKLMSYFLFSFTVSSGVAVQCFRFLVDLDTPDAHEAVEQALSRVHRNEDFKEFIGVLQQANKLELLHRLEHATLSQSKAAILRSALASATHHAAE
jgi:hypothetical protein